MDFTDLPLDGHVYRIGRMDALTQFHVARRLGPVIASLAEGGADFSILDVMAGATQVIAKMSDEDVNYIINRCLLVVARVVEGSRPAPVMRGNQFMFNDITMPQMVRLAVEVIKENLGPFFPGLLAAIATQSGSEAQAAQ